MRDKEKNILVRNTAKAGHNQHVTRGHKSKKAIVFLVLAAIAAVLYLGFTNNSFVISDITDARIKSFSLNEVFSILAEMEKPWQVLPNLSFLLNHHLAGDNTYSYYVINVIFHLINSFLIFLLAFKILMLGHFKGKYKDSAQMIAFVSALVFLVHPVAVFTTSYIIQRATLFFSFFFLISMLAFIDHKSAAHEEEEKRSLVICIIFGLLALLCKETALAILPIYLVFDILFFDDKRVDIIKKVDYYIGVTILIVAAYIVVISMSYDIPITEYFSYAYDGTGPNLYERILTQFRVVLMYIVLILFPAPGSLSVEYDIARSTSVFEPVTTIASIAVVVSLIAVTHIKKKKNPLVSFFILWYLINLAADVVPPHETAYLHNAYLPSFAIFFAIGYYLVELKKYVGDKYKEQKLYGHLVSLLFCVIISGLIFVSVTENMLFKSKVLLWEDALMTSPEKESVLYNLAMANLEIGKYEKARKYYQKAFDKNPNNVMTNYNMANAFFKLERYSLAQAHYKRAIDLDWDFIDAYEKLAELYVKVMRYDYAIKELEKILYIKPDHVKAYTDLAQIYYTLGRLEESLEYYIKAIELSPDDAYLHFNAARLYERLGDYKNALKEYETVLEIDMNFEYKDEIAPKIKEMIKRY